MLLSPDNPDGLHGNQSILVDQSRLVNIENNIEQTKYHHQSYSKDHHHYNQIEPNYFNHQYTSNQSNPDQMQFELAILQPSDSTLGTSHSVPAQTQNERKLKRSNAEKCKEFRDREKKKMSNLIAELEREGNTKSRLAIRAQLLEDT